jgi:N-acetylglucosamine-6-sulfatase
MAFVSPSRVAADRRPALTRLLVVLVALACAGLTLQATTAPGRAAPRPDPRPNIVFVLTDDLDSSLLRYMPHVRALAARGTSFADYIVADSWCCPSRASILTGEFPHNTGVRNNGTLPDGGFDAFQSHGDEDRTFAVHLHDAGYRTAFLGKYLNGYSPTSSTNKSAPGPVPRGWDYWYGLGRAYSSYGYTANDNGRLDRHGSAPADYLNTVLSDHAASFLDSAATRRAPFLLEVASFTPHSPYVAAPADQGTFTSARADRDAAWDTLPTDPPAWLAGVPPLDSEAQRTLDRVQVRRVQAVQSVDRMVAGLQDRLAANGQLADTVFVFSSDNGYHLGEYRLRSGKQTAYDTDIRVPLIVAGPGIPANTVDTNMAENIDLRPTFEQLAGAPTPPAVEGRSLVPLLHGQDVPWRTYALIEHHYDPRQYADPDKQDVFKSPVPPTYNAIRTRNFVYVRYVDGEREYYNLVKDPYELHNLGPSLPPARRAALDKIMNRLIACHSGAQCWTAGVPNPG